ncbi:MAG: hypothetical protein IJ661_10765 [Lachnospiraceae bacterium]|nr:hypothetical protein [Lachnospiraceae bacterium]
MTLRQEAYSMIDSLPDDDSIQFFIDMIKQFNLVVKNKSKLSEKSDEASEKRQAFLRMEEMKKTHPFPKNYDYEKVREEAMAEKYGRFN